MTASQHRDGRCPALLRGLIGPLACWQWLVLVGLALSLYTIELGESRALTEHEIYVAGTAAQMAQDGEWILPRIGDQYWLEKPPLPHWVVIASSTILGGFSEFSVRLPSALAGVGVVLIVAWISARLFDSTVGFLTGLVQASTQYMIAYARLAEADMLLLLMVVSAIAAFVSWNALPIDAPRRARDTRLILFWGLVGMTNLAKGPLFGAVLILLTCAGWPIVCRDWSRLKQLLLAPIGLLLAVGGTVLWPLFVIRIEPAAFDLWTAHLFGRAATGIGYSEPFYYYLTTWAWQLLPWTPILFFGAAASLKRAWRDRHSPDCFLWWWMLSQMALLSLSSGKHHHYLIHALPALSPVIALGLLKCADLNARRTRFSVNWGRLLLGLGATATVVSVVANVPGGEWRNNVLWPCGIVAFGGVSIGYFTVRGWPRPTLVSFVSILLLANLYVQGSLMPHRDRSRADREFLRRVDRELPEDCHVIVTGGSEIVRHIFYLQRSVTGIWEPAQIGTSLAERDTAYVVTRAGNRGVLEQFGRVSQLGQSEHTRSERSPADRYTLFRLQRDSTVASRPNAVQ